MAEPVLEIQGLSMAYQVGSNLFQRGGSSMRQVVRDVSLSIGRNEIVGLVGESGSGKTTLARAVVGLNRVAEGSIAFHGKDLVGRRRVCVQHPKIQMVFQDPNNSLDPRMTIQEILAEPIIIARTVRQGQIRDYCVELLETMDLKPGVLERRPHQLSGGQRQRVGIARALSTQPELIIADECTSALDVTVQAHVLNLLMDLKASSDVSILFISHNLGVVRHVADHVAVMKDGELVETGPSARLFSSPQAEYTRQLLDAIPAFNRPSP